MITEDRAGSGTVDKPRAYQQTKSEITFYRKFYHDICFSGYNFHKQLHITQNVMTVGL